MNQRGVLLETPGAWSEPLLWPLREGERKLLTVGSNADWSIADGALLPIHATLYFDGASLCVAAAPGATLNGEPLGQDWSPVALPARLSLGDTKITLATSEPELVSDTERTELQSLNDKTTIMGFREVVSDSERSELRSLNDKRTILGFPGMTPVSERSELQSLNDKTTIMGFPDLDEFRQAARLAGSRQRFEAYATSKAEAAEVDRPTPTGAFQSPFVDPDATRFAMPALSPPPMVTAAPMQLPRVQPAPTLTEPPARSSFMTSFRGASWPKRLTVLLLPVVIGLYGVKAVRARKDSKRAIPAPSASTARKAPSAPSAAATSPALAAAPAAQAPTGDARASGLTLQRRAVDAFASGNFRDAALLYQRLAAENPKQAAFAVAARVASERANGVGHD